MNRLKKKAYINLAFMTFCVIIAALGVGIGYRYNIKGPVPIISFVIPACLMGLFATIHEINKRTIYDERENKMIIQASRFGFSCFILFVMFSTFTIFYIVGGRGQIPAYVFPIIALIGLFVMGLADAITLLIFMTRESDE